MKLKSTLLFGIIFLLLSQTFAQNKYQKQKEDKDIVTIFDDLRENWDQEAVKLETYEGLKDFCRIKPYRENVIELLDNIHHYDTTLYQTVKAKFDLDQNPEAKATLDDIEELEKDYRTRSFLKFLHKECNTFNDIERNYGRSKGPEYEKEVTKLEKEMVKYVEAIKELVDVIDDHIHHLKGL